MPRDVDVDNVDDDDVDDDGDIQQRVVCCDLAYRQLTCRPLASNEAVYFDIEDFATLCRIVLVEGAKVVCKEE